MIKYYELQVEKFYVIKSYDDHFYLQYKGTCTYKMKPHKSNTCYLNLYNGWCDVKCYDEDCCDKKKRISLTGIVSSIQNNFLFSSSMKIKEAIKKYINLTTDKGVVEIERRELFYRAVASDYLSAEIKNNLLDNTNTNNEEDIILHEISSTYYKIKSSNRTFNVENYNPALINKNFVLIYII